MLIVPHLIGRAALSIGEPEPLVRTRRSRRAMRRVAGAPAQLREAASFVNALIDDGGYRRRTRSASSAAGTTAQPANNPTTCRPTARRPGPIRRVLWESEVIESMFVNPLARALIGAGVIGGSVGFAYSILSTATGDTLLLGPGLGIPIHGLGVYRDIVRHLTERNQLVVLATLGAAAAATTVVNVVTSLQGYFRSRTTEDGTDTFPAKEMALFSVMNAVNLGMLLASYQVFRGVGTLLGFDPQRSYDVVTELSTAARSFVIATVPTIVSLHPLAAFLTVFQVSGIFHYALHRCGHELRLFWLLFHRQHHFPTLLHALNTPFVVSPFPMSMLMAVPYHVLFSGVMKLFVPESSLVDYLVYYVIYKMLYMVSDVYAHQSGLYHRAVDNRLMWGAGLATGSGVHHYLHHSSLASDGEFTNITNVGGGFFYIWDRVFRTYRPADHDRPPIGLTGAPALHENPVRLALSGMAQLAYEIRHNRSARERALILLGHVSYAPPLTVDFAIKPAV